MESSTKVVIERDKPKPKWYVNAADFANMVKAFIGSNYLSVAFAFSQSGLGLGIVGMLIIAFLTDHCCHLIVKTKHHAIRKLLGKNSHSNKSTPANRQNYNSYDTQEDSGLDDEDGADTPFISPSSAVNSDEESGIQSSSDHHEHIVRHMMYGDIGKLCYGKYGVGVVNLCIAVTQFGFCVAYFIFIGNTVYSLFPKEKCAIVNGSVASHCDRVYNLSSEVHIQPRDLIPSKDLFNVSSSYDSSTIFPSNSTTTTIANITTTVANITTTTTTAQPIIPLFAYIETAPDLKILVACPLVVFVFFALIRNVRYLGIISVLANFSILGGCLSVFIFLIIDFEVKKGIENFRIEGFPLFFGMVTGAFEGIGLVIPIESSMVGNRHLFPAFLHGAVLILSLILGTFGIMGYMKFGSDVHQMLNTNLPQGSSIAMIVNVGICIGILLTFPLQIYPVIEIMEKYLFAEGRICGPKKDITETESEGDALMPSDTEPLVGHEGLATHIPDTVSACKRNILRILIVLFAGGLAVLLKDNFAYVGAFVGAVGSSVLGFILPCLFHLKMCWSDLHKAIIIKDIAIIIFGIFASVISVVSVIEEIARNYTP